MWLTEILKYQVSQCYNLTNWTRVATCRRNPNHQHHYPIPPLLHLVVVGELGSELGWW